MRSACKTFAYAMVLTIMALNTSLVANRIDSFGSLLATAGPHMPDHPTTSD